jgi:hypothetical protein
MGDRQHDFKADTGIQKPSTLVTNLIQNAQHTHRPFQLVSLDIKKHPEKKTSCTQTAFAKFWQIQHLKDTAD